MTNRHFLNFDNCNTKMTNGQYEKTKKLTFGHFLVIIYIYFKIMTIGGTILNKTDQKKQLKIDSIMQSTLELFIAKGINDTSVSDIVESSGVAKGTFYLYFKDKYDVKNILVAHESFKIFIQANTRLEASGIERFEDKIIFLANDILDQLAANKRILTLISKNLSWGVFKKNLFEQQKKHDMDYREIYHKMIEDSPHSYEEPELMLYLILEFVNGTCYSSILYDDPLPLEKMKPYLFRTIRNIITSHQIE